MASSSENFFGSLTAIAADEGSTRAALLRELLPFDENTSSNDQSSVSDAVVRELLRRRKHCDDSHRRALMALHEQAIHIRRTIRVKMADEADLQQVRSSSDVIALFIDRSCDRCDAGRTESQDTELILSFTQRQSGQSLFR